MTPSVADYPLVSVLIVNYNYGHYLAAAVDSVLEQTFENFEIVICDDGSTDNSRDIISSYRARDARVRSILKANAGVAAALNDAFRASGGEIITMLDADDLYRPTKVARIVTAFSADPDIGMVIHPLTKVNNEQHELGTIPQFGLLHQGDLRDLILRTGGIWEAPPTSGISFRRNCAEAVFPIPETEFRTEADGYMRNRAALLFPVAAIDEALAVYRVHTSNVTASLTLDQKWCAKIRSATQRIYGSVAETARKHDWRITPLEKTAAYCEVNLVCDYLERTSYSRNLVNSLALLRVAYTRRDVPKWSLKAIILSITALLPHPVGRHLLQIIYLPGGIKRRLARFLRA